ASDADRVVSTNQEVYEAAKITPPTHYFTSPYEAMADAEAHYRSDPNMRASLLKEHPEAYDVAKEWDQRELDKFYGTKNGSPVEIRNFYGTPVPNTPEAAAETAAYEAKYRS